MSGDVWEFPAKFVGAVDGDTIDLLVDVGFDIRAAVRLRVADLWCPEVRGSEREEGLRSKLNAARWLGADSDLEFPLWLTCHGRRSFSRWVGSLEWRDTGEQFADYMVLNGFGRAER